MKKFKNINPVKKGEKLYIYTDGASRGNPGPSAIAFVFVKEGEETPIYTYSEYIGKTTNNTAEYVAVIRALEKAVEFTRWDVQIFSDSELLVKQINGEYRIKKPHLKDLADQVYEKMKFFKHVKIIHVPRHNKYTQLADSLSNKALDKALHQNR